MPVAHGKHWFAKELKDRDLAEVVGVSKHEYADGTVRFIRSGDWKEGSCITPDEGWWLQMPDLRMTAEIEEANGG